MKTFLGLIVLMIRAILSPLGNYDSPLRQHYGDIPGPWNSPWFLAQVTHLFIAATIVLACKLAGWPWCPVLPVLCWAVPKEYGFDILVEEDTWTGSTIDFAFYVVGASVTASLTYLL